MNVRGFGRAPAVESGGEGVDDFVVVYGTGDGYDGVAGGVVGVEIVEELVAGDGVYGVPGAADVAAEGVVGPDELVKEDFNPLVGGVLDHVELFEDDAALFFDVLGVEAGVAEHVDEEVEGLGEVGEGDPGPVGRDLLVGGAVECASDALDGLGDLLGEGSLLGAF